MSAIPLTPAVQFAEQVAGLRRAAEADAEAARARLESVLRLLILTLVATLAGRLERLAMAQLLAIGSPAAAHPAPTAAHPVAARSHGRVFRAARHAGPVPARRLRLGRQPTWFAAHYGAIAVPGPATYCHAFPARAPPFPGHPNA